MDVNVKPQPDQGELLEDAGRYRRSVGKLNYTVRPDITFAVSLGTEDYPFGGGNEDFEVPEENSRERASLFRL